MTINAKLTQRARLFTNLTVESVTTNNGKHFVVISDPITKQQITLTHSAAYELANALVDEIETNAERESND